MENEGLTKEWLTEAQQWHKTLRSVQNRPKVFTPEIVFQIAAMTIEKFFMAMLAKYSMLPMNHTMADFIAASGELLPLRPELKRVLYEMDRDQQLCSLTPSKQEPPTAEEMYRFLQATDEIALLAQQELS